MSDEPQVVRANPHPYGEQDAYGNSVGSLRENLKLTPIERLRRAERAARFAVKYRGIARPTNRV